MYYSYEEAKVILEKKSKYLVIDYKEHVLNITLNRPEKKNAMDGLFMRELAMALAFAKGNNDIRVVLIKANGDIFSAGADLKGFAGKHNESEDSPAFDKNSKVILGDEFKSIYKPCIAKVHAPVYAGGFLILGGCTHVLSTLKATYTLPEVKRGLWPFQVMESLMDIIPSRKLLDWCMLGTTLSANKAFEYGIVTQVTQDEEDLDQSTEKLIKEIISNSPTAIRMGIKAYHELQELKKNERNTFLHGRLQELIQSKDAQEGLQAFLEKRKPKWTGE
ncbi:MAG: enoyl-CoA hydratase [Chitinophagaceae bacterium]|nr:MAG: enoyl-CoA hydratase [Chitinophagaceae bacterium]